MTSFLPTAEIHYSIFGKEKVRNSYAALLTNVNEFSKAAKVV
ncbi:MAG: hypothetical protein ACJ75F_09725 [Flavisolibacter sp.]|jgi:hypothetical protein